MPARYEGRGLLGRGGQGVVYRVHDRELEREIALKTVHLERLSPEERRFFQREARAAAGLEHPNIVPIHDVGELPDGRPYYTMRLVPGRSLDEVLDQLEADSRLAAPAPAASGSGELRAADWSIHRLAQVLQQVCRALQAAHERGVIHRDVKPANILLGELDEVLVVDWGIAKSSAQALPATTTGVVKGTVAYMSPEQARGAVLDPRSDVYSVGVLLYQFLTLRLPFEAPTTVEVIASILRDEVPRPEERSPGRRIPPELAELAMRALEKDPADRVASARDFADELQAFLGGLRDKERRQRAAEKLDRAGRLALEQHAAALSEAAGLRAEIGRLEELHPPWQAVAEKLPLIDARAMAEELEAGSWRSFLEGVNRYTDALVHVPEHAGIRGALSELFWERFCEAEERGQAALAETYRMLVERWHDGRRTQELDGRGRLVLDLHPKEAATVLHPQVEQDLVLVDGPGRALGSGDVDLELAMGSYVLVASADGHETARYPVWIGRCETWSGELRLLPEGALPEGFVYLPGAEAWLGGDPQATNAWPRRRERVASFALARHPVTFGEFCEFLDGSADPDEDLPRTETTGALCRRGEAGRFAPDPERLQPTSRALALSADELCRLPVFGVDLASARRHAGWRSRRDGARYRLPSAVEREFAARSVDSRTYPWGHRFDPALCHVRESLEGQPEVLPVGRFSADCSVHGVRDLGGCMQEWTDSPFDAERELIEVRGGGWSVGGPVVRSCWRGVAAASTRSVHLGLRLAAEVRRT